MEADAYRKTSRSEAQIRRDLVDVSAKHKLKHVKFQGLADVSHGMISTRAALLTLPLPISSVSDSCITASTKMSAAARKDACVWMNWTFWLSHCICSAGRFCCSLALFRWDFVGISLGFRWDFVGD